MLGTCISIQQDVLTDNTSIIAKCDSLAAYEITQLELQPKSF